MKYFLNSLILVILLFTSGFLFGNESYESIVKETYSERQNFFVRNFYDNENLKKDSLAFFQELNKLKKLAIEKNDEELLYECIFMRLNYLSSRKYPNYISEQNDLIRQVDKKKILHLQIRTRQALGFYYYHELNDYGNALFQFLKSYEFLKNISQDDFPEKQEALTNIANICYNVGYESKALEHLEEAEKLNYKYNEGLKYNILNTKAMIFEDLGEIHKAIEIHRKIFKETQNTEHHEWNIISNNHLVKLLFNQNKINEASQYLNELNSEFTLEFECENEKRAILIAQIALAKKQFTTFNSHIQDLLNKHQNHSVCPENKIDYLSTLYTYYKQNNDYHNTLIIADQLLRLIKESDKKAQSNQVKNAIERNNYEILKAKEEELNKSKKINLYLNIFYFLVCVALIWVFIKIYKRKKKHHHFHLLEKQNKLDEKEQEILKANEFIRKFKADIVEKNKIIEEMAEILTAKNENFFQNDEEAVNKLVILTDEDWKRFRKEFITLHPQFFPALRERAPQITPALERLAALLYLDFNFQQIANTLGISKESVSRTNRRLKMLLQIPKDQQFLQWFEENFENKETTH